MAIWDGSSYNTDALSSAVNKWMDLNMTPIVVKNNALLYAMMGMSGAETTPNWNSIFKKDYQIVGNNLVCRLLGELDTISTLADANQTDAASLTTNLDAIGGAQWAWTHYSFIKGIRDSEFELIKGEPARTVSYIEDQLEIVRKSWENTVGTAINSTNDQARTTLGGWEYAIDSTGTYGTLTRAGDNPDWSANETAVNGPLQLDHLDALKLDCIQDGGRPSIGVTGKIGYTALQQELRGYAQIRDSSWSLFNGGTLSYDGVTYVFEHRCTSTVLGLLDPSTFRFYLKNEKFESNVIMNKDILRVAYKGMSVAIPVNFWAAFVNRHPGANGKLTGLTA